jgi:CDP-diglyceride synthetase
MVPTDVTGSALTVKCVTCDRKGVKKISIAAVLKRNLFLLGVIFGYWIFAIFPLPFLQLGGYEATAIVLQPVLIASGALTIPFIFMVIAWQRRAPKES